MMCSSGSNYGLCNELLLGQITGEDLGSTGLLVVNGSAAAPQQAVTSQVLAEKEMFSKVDHAVFAKALL
jgi:hypothetical protein